MVVDELQHARPARVGRWAVVVAALVVFQAIWLRAQLGGAFATMVFADLLAVVVTAVAAGVCFATARRVGRGGRRRAWALLGCAVMSWGLGQMVWSYYELILRQEPFPSFADAGFLGTIPLAAAAVLSFSSDAKGARGMTRGVRTLLDGMIIAGSLLFVSWATVLGPLTRSEFTSPLEQFLTLAYPAGDVVVLAVTIFLLARTRNGRLPLMLVALGLVALSVADSGFTYLVLHDAYSTGSFIDVVWNIGFMLIALGALSQQRARIAVPATAPAPSTGGVLIPYVPAALAVVVAGTEAVSRGGLGTFLTWNAVAVVAVVLVRQLITLLDNVALNRDLAAKVEERTADLRATVRRLEDANVLQESFIASVSHELRTPLTLIIGAASTLTRPDLGLADPARGLAEITLRGAERMSRLVEDLIVASGIADGGQGTREEIRLIDVAAGVLRGSASAYRRFAVDVPAGLAVYGDAGSLSVVLRQLVSNAEKFSLEGSTVHVQARERGDWVEIVVADEGAGIDERDREKIFDRFTQLDGTSTRRHGGLGLGLYLARCLTQAMGGTIAVIDDERFSGATFRVTLASSRGAARADDMATAPEPLMDRSVMTRAAS